MKVYGIEEENKNVPYYKRFWDKESLGIEEIDYVKINRFFTRDKSYNPYIMDKLKYYEKLIGDGKEACMLAMQKREINNKKRFD